MELLNFSMPPYARTVWASQALKDEWEPKVLKAKDAYYKLEKLTVIHGLRRATTEHIPGHQLAEGMKQLSKAGLTFLPITQVGAYAGFSHYHPPVIDGKPWTWYGSVARTPEDAHTFAAASSMTEETKHLPVDHETIGRLLGYPDCCREFFNRVWTAGYIDPIWQEAENCKDENIVNREDHLIQLSDKIPPITSVMLRYIGIRVLPHIPCSHDCEHSIKMAQDWVQLGLDLKLEGMDELLELLNLPVEWNCLKGIAYISTPLFKIETNSMTCYPTYIVQKEGSLRPKGTPNGLKFPFIPMGSEKYAHLFSKTC